MLAKANLAAILDKLQMRYCLIYYEESGALNCFLITCWVAWSLLILPLKAWYFCVASLIQYVTRFEWTVGLKACPKIKRKSIFLASLISSTWDLSPDPFLPWFIFLCRFSAECSLASGFTPPFPLSSLPAPRCEDRWLRHVLHVQRWLLLLVS